MARRMILVSEGSEVMLNEADARDEAQLQDRVKNSPDLLPFDDFGVPGPLLVVGRETSLPSGAADLLALAPTGDVLVIEMKTGPQNSDFRAALAQATDYGADLWQMTVEVFESAVAARYFASGHCDPAFRGLTSLAEAARRAWPTLTDEEHAAFAERLGSVLATGEFCFVVVAQQFTPFMVTTARYLNSISAGRARYFLVELIRFSGYESFEARTIPSFSSSAAAAKAAGPSIDEAAFLEKVADPAYREAVERLFETCRGLDLRFSWGTSGASIRLLTPHRKEPISVGWVFPPGRSGWQGLRDITLGYDVTQLAGADPARPAFERYLATISGLPGATRVTVKDVDACTFRPDSFVTATDAAIEAVAAVVQQAGGS